jgi:hypothetical protein
MNLEYQTEFSADLLGHKAVDILQYFWLKGPDRLSLSDVALF